MRSRRHGKGDGPDYTEQISEHAENEYVFYFQGSSGYFLKIVKKFWILENWYTFEILKFTKTFFV